MSIVTTPQESGSQWLDAVSAGIVKESTLVYFVYLGGFPCLTKSMVGVQLTPVIVWAERRRYNHWPVVHIELLQQVC